MNLGTKIVVVVLSFHFDSSILQIVDFSRCRRSNAALKGLASASSAIQCRIEDVNQQQKRCDTFEPKQLRAIPRKGLCATYSACADPLTSSSDFSHCVTPPLLGAPALLGGTGTD